MVYCEICKKELKSATLTQHKKTKRHISRLPGKYSKETKLDAIAIENIIQRLMDKVITCRELRKQFIPEFDSDSDTPEESPKDNDSLEELD